MQNKNNKPMSTFEREMQDPKRRKAFEKEFKKQVFSELLLALIRCDKKSVRELAKLAGLSPTTIQNIRSGKQTDIWLSNFISIAKACGYKLVLENENADADDEDRRIVFS